MSTKCRECGNYIEEGIKVCPECGCPNPNLGQKEEETPPKNIFKVLAIIFVLGCAICLLLPDFLEDPEVKIVKDSFLEWEPDYTIENYMDNYYGEGGKWESPYDGYVEYTSPDEFVVVGYRLDVESDEYQIESISYSDGRYLTSDMDLLNYLVETYGYTSDKIRNDIGPIVNSLNGLQDFAEQLDNFYNYYNYYY